MRYSHSFFISPVVKSPISHFYNITCKTSLLKVFVFYLLTWLKALPVFRCFTFLLNLLALSSPPQQFHHLHTASFVIRLGSVLETVSFPSLVLGHVQAAEQNQDKPAACCLPVLTKERSRQTSGKCRATKYDR